MIVRMHTSLGAHLLRNMTGRPSEIHPSVLGWGPIALSMKSRAEFTEWVRVAQGLRALGLAVVPSWRLEEGPREGIEDIALPFVSGARWRDNLDVSHMQMDALSVDTFVLSCEAYKATEQRSPSDIRSDWRYDVREECERFAQRLGARKVYVGPSSADCLLTRALVKAGIDTIGVIQGNVQLLGAPELFGENRGALVGWYHDRALRLHQSIPGARAIPQLYTSALRAHATPLPETIPEALVYTGVAEQFSRATEKDIGTRAWFNYETESPLNVGCRWYGPGPRDDVFPRGRTYSVIVRGAQWCGADKPNERSWCVDRAGAIYMGAHVVGQTIPGSTIAVVSTESAAQILARGTIVTLSPLQQAGHIYGEGITSIEAWDRALTPAEIETAIHNPYPRLKP